MRVGKDCPFLHVEGACCYMRIYMYMNAERLMFKNICVHIIRCSIIFCPHGSKKVSRKLSGLVQKNHREFVRELSVS